MKKINKLVALLVIFAMAFTFFVAAQLSGAENTARFSPQSTEILGIFVEDNSIIVAFNSFIPGTTLVIGVYCGENRFITSANAEITDYVVVIENFSVPLDATRVKAMVWDSTNTMRPLGGYAMTERHGDEWVFTPAEYERITAEVSNNTLTLSGYVTPNSFVFIRIFCPDNQLEQITEILSDNIGLFVYEYYLSNSVNGTYLAVISVAGYDEPMSVTFDVGTPSERTPMSFNLPTTVMPIQSWGMAFAVNGTENALLVNDGILRVITAFENYDPENVQYVTATVVIYDQNDRMVNFVSTAVSVAPLGIQQLENIIQLPADVTGHSWEFFLNEGLNLYHYGMIPLFEPYIPLQTNLQTRTQNEKSGARSQSNVTLLNFDLEPNRSGERILVSNDVDMNELLENLTAERIEAMNQLPTEDLGIMNVSSTVHFTGAVTSILRNDAYIENHLIPGEDLTFTYSITNTGTTTGFFMPIIIGVARIVYSDEYHILHYMIDLHAMVRIEPGHTNRFTVTFSPPSFEGEEIIYFAISATGGIHQGINPPGTTGDFDGVMMNLHSELSGRDFFGNSIERATGVTLNRDIRGAINRAGDVDYVRVRNGTPTNIIVENQGTGSQDLIVSAYDASRHYFTQWRIPAGTTQSHRIEDPAVRYIRISGAAGTPYRMRIEGESLPITAIETPTSVTFYARVLFCDWMQRSAQGTAGTSETYVELFTEGVKSGWGGNFGGREISVEFIDAGTNPAPNTYIAVSRVHGSTSTGSPTSIRMSTGHANNGRESFMSTSSHEFGHALGLWDIFGDTDFAVNSTSGINSLMNAPPGFLDKNAQPMDYEMLLTFRTWEQPIALSWLPYSWPFPVHRDSNITPRHVVWRHYPDVVFRTFPQTPEDCLFLR